jgi:hypothetical protein
MKPLLIISLAKKKGAEWKHGPQSPIFHRLLDEFDKIYMSAVEGEL